MTGWTKQFQIIPRGDADMWRACGWHVEELRSHHGFWSVHVWRWA